MGLRGKNRPLWLSAGNGAANTVRNLATDLAAWKNQGIMIHSLAVVNDIGSKSRRA
jgi:hypothetical protein